MKITKKMLDCYHAKRFGFDGPTNNEDYNARMGLPTMKQWDFIANVHSDNFGMFPGTVTMAMIKRAGGV